VVETSNLLISNHFLELAGSLLAAARIPLVQSREEIVGKLLRPDLQRVPVGSVA